MFWYFSYSVLEFKLRGARHVVSLFGMSIAVTVLSISQGVQCRQGFGILKFDEHQV